MNWFYNSAEVFVDDMENVTQVQEQLAAMGYQVNSQMDFLESSRQQSNMVQAVLGGIGAVSLFVAAIGIANTMMMSIYERTKEIGVMKVLGCDMGNIRNMFLIESGFIGFMGGTIGVALSYGVSAIVNRFVNMSQSMGLSGGSVPDSIMAFHGSHWLCCFCRHGRRLYAGSPRYEIKPSGSYSERIGHRAVHKQK